VLNITSSIEDLGGFQWELTGTLLLAWIIVYLIVWKGLHSSGKVISAYLITPIHRYL
jgi:solute carrier family 6 GABA transporter-like protein 6/8/11/12/13